MNNNPFEKDLPDFETSSSFEVLEYLKYRDHLLVKERATSLGAPQWWDLKKQSTMYTITIDISTAFLIDSSIVVPTVFEIDVPLENLPAYVDITSSGSLYYSPKHSPPSILYVDEDRVLMVYTKLSQLDGVHPIGSTYDQKPGTKSPQDLFPFANWIDISDSFPYMFIADTSQFEKGVMQESLPNIKFSVSTPGGDAYGVHESAYGAAYLTNTNKRVFQGGGTTNYPAVGQTLNVDASRSNPAYQDESSVLPNREAIRIWQRVGELEPEKTRAYIYDPAGEYVKHIDLNSDETGLIGFNPNCMTLTKPKGVD